MYAIPFIVAMFLILISEGLMTIMKGRVLKDLDDRTKKHIQTDQAKDQVAPNIPFHLSPEHLDDVISWVSDASQVIAVVFAPFLGLAALASQSDTLLAWMLAVAALLPGGAAFLLVYKFKDATTYATYAQTKVAALTAKKGLLRKIAIWWWKAAMKTGSKFVTAIGLSLNFLLAIAAFGLGFA
ncbi:hypothetical protein ACWIID_30145 [Streptomyces phaeochromogenes]